MDKIGQVTYCGQNYGSVLQCYATQHILSKNNLKCVLIKRKESGIGKLLHSMEFRFNRWYKYVRYPKYKQKFNNMLKIISVSGGQGMNQESVDKTNEFIRDYINKEEISYYKLKKLARKDDYIAFFSGSDQIWSATWFIKNRIWFLRFAPKNKRVAWMPSFGSEKVEEYNIPEYKKYISEYEFLSSREESGAKIITELTGRKTISLADPVILLGAEEWRNLADKNTYSEKYILLFFLDTPSETALEMIQRLHKYTNYKLVVFSYEHECFRNIEVKSGGPKEFISIINNAEFVLTDSFHACMFSIIFNVPYYVFYRNTSYVSKQSARINNLLETYGMNRRLIKAVRNIEKGDFEMDEKHISLILNEKKKEILEYFECIMKKYKN